MRALPHPTAHIEENGMDTTASGIVTKQLAAVAVAALLAAGGCATRGGGAPVTIGTYGPNVVSSWDEIAVATVALPPSPGGATPEERRPGPDVATVHIAMHDAIVAITGGPPPFAARPAAPTAGASADAAAVEAAYRVLKGLFPSRSDKYQAAYDRAMASLPAGDARTRGVAVGAEVAAKVLALRRNDGRSADLPPYVAGTGVGQFRGSNPINRLGPVMRPLAVADFAAFRPAAAPLLTGPRYARDFAEVAAFGSSASTVRTAEQLEVARFHTEPPGAFWARNLRRFATSQPALADNAHLMARLWVSYQDAVGACFAAKYHYNTWRPLSAIVEADRDDNPATAADPAWTPVVPTPNHPEYPAAHSCAASAVAEALNLHFRTSRIAFEFNSTASPKLHRYASTDEFVAEIGNARVWGGMHFRQATEDGAALGRAVARAVATRFAAGPPAGE
jgi:hypothetical protein